MIANAAVQNDCFQARHCFPCLLGSKHQGENTETGGLDLMDYFLYRASNQ